MSVKRLKEFEALRGLAILLLLALHSEVFDPGIFGEAFDTLASFVATFLLGSFFFLAGYFTEVSIRKPGGSAWHFIWSKLIRIYPPYWLALFLFIYVLEYDLSRSALAVYGLNLQAVFSPTFIKPLLTLWYISMLVVFYILIGGLMLVIRSHVGLVIAALAVYLLALWAHLSNGFFDPRFFQYYFIFLTGVFACRFDFAFSASLKANGLIKIILAVISVLLLQWVLISEYPIVHGVRILASGSFILSWVLLWLTIFRTNVGNWGIWSRLSTASFYAYLIHRPLWRIMDGVLGLEKDLTAVLVHLLPGAMLALVLGYFLQRGYDSLLAAARLKS